MPKRIIVLLTWTTRNRADVIDQMVATFLEEFLPRAAKQRGALVHAVGIVTDHVHVVLDLPLVIDVPRLVQGLKGASARIANRDKIASKDKLRWANGYDLRSVAAARDRLRAASGGATSSVVGPALKGKARPRKAFLIGPA